MRDTTSIGNATQGIVVGELMRHGKSVLLPFGEGHPYDVAYDDNGVLVRVQCKTGRIARGGGAIEFRAHTVKRDGTREDYRGRCELFAVYVPDLNKVYWVPVDQVPVNTVFLRILPTLNNQERGLRWARDFERLS